MEYIWEGNTIYRESIMVVANEEGQIEPIPLLYHADEILKVESSDYKITYLEGQDYTLQDGKLQVLREGQIPVMEYDEYYPEKPQKDRSFPCTKGGYICFTEDGFFHRQQVLVTYKHSDVWEYETPASQGDKLSNLKKKMAGKEQLNVVFYGDSITWGANSSGMMKMEPYVDMWPIAVTNYLRSENPNIHYVNTAVGGMDSNWGKNNVQKLVVEHNPDLLVLAFGMNDVDKTVEQYTDCAREMIEAVRKGNPACDIILVATMLPNKEVVGFWANQIHFVKGLRELANTYEHVAVADMTTMHANLLQKKRFYDMTGNNVNHNNDWLASVYAQVVIKAMES